MLKRLKYSVAEKIKQHPYTMSAVWNRLPRLSFLLPHDRSYLGFPHIATKPEGLFLDIGANNGVSAAGFRKLNKHYRILSLEANKLHCPALQSLQQHIQKFDFQIVAVGSSPGLLTLITPVYRGRALHTHTSSSREYLATSLHRDYSEEVVAAMSYLETQVEMRTVDQLNLSPDIVKIDVEGFDYQVLLGMQDTIVRCRPYFMVEFTPDHMQDFFNFFQQHQYSLFIYQPAVDRFRPFDQARDADDWRRDHLQVNIYCAPVELSNTLPVGD